MPVAGIAHTGRAAQLRADQGQRELPGQQFVEGQARPEGLIRQNVRELDRLVHPGEGFRDRREIAAAQHLRADPFRQGRQFLQRLRDRATQRAERKAFGQGIDGIDAGEL